LATATDLTVKKYDGTTDITYSLIAASGGDKSAALWRSSSALGTVGQKPWFSVIARPNQKGDVRRVDISGSYPSVYTNSTTGQTEVRSTMSFTASFAVPQNVVSADIGEFGKQMVNLMATSLISGSIISGFAPT